MKKIISVFISVVLIALSCIFAYSSEQINLPEILTVKAVKNGDYGYVDYSFENINGSSPGLFNGKIIPDSSVGTDSPFPLSQSAPMTAIPSSFDSRNNGYVTASKQQGYSGNCWAFSAMSLLETDSVIKGFADVENADYSEAHLSWFASRSLTDNTEDPTYGDGKTDDNPFSSGGNWIIAAGALARWSGVANESDYPFSPLALEEMGNYDESCRYDTGSGVVIESAEAFVGMSDAKEWIMTHGSATFSFYYEKSYYRSGTNAYYYNGDNTLNHQIAVVGWDDSYSLYNFNESCRPSGNGAWLCKNSWGESWGNGGYFWISYYDNSISQFSGISARSTENLVNNYTYNGTSWESSVSHEGTAKIANVFTCEGNEALNSVSTYTLDAGMDVNVYIYKNLPENYSGPQEGELVLTQSVLVERPGYHTIDLETKIPLSPGTIFSVVIEYVSDSTVYIPVEVDNQGTNSYSANQGESFAYLPQYNEGWYDTLRYSLKNVFIQAFTECNHSYVEVKNEPTCIEEGSVSLVCDYCGRIESEAVLPASGHDFSEWSDYKHDFETDTEVSTRTCVNCGFTETHSIVHVKNTITLEDFLEMLFERIFEFLRNIFR